jgi:hypothetical protein
VRAPAQSKEQHEVVIGPVEIVILGKTTCDRNSEDGEIPHSLRHCRSPQRLLVNAHSAVSYTKREKKEKK